MKQYWKQRGWRQQSGVKEAMPSCSNRKYSNI
jgi:hypothetical protein